MPKHTDLDAVRRIAKTFLYLDIKETKYSPIVVHHPFASSGITTVKDTSGFRMINLLEDSAGLQEWRKDRLRFIQEAEDVHSIFIQMTKPYALAFLKEIEGCLSREDLASLLRETWIRIEFVSDNPIYSKAQFSRLFRSCDKTQLMDPDEYQRYQALPETVEIYRGIRDGSKKVKGMSWSTSLSVANWFANRFSGQESGGDVYKATISKQDILAYFLGRNEEEVVVDIKGLRNIEKVARQPELRSMIEKAETKTAVLQEGSSYTPQDPER